jgi:hypothetical protein
VCNVRNIPVISMVEPLRRTLRATLHNFYLKCSDPSLPDVEAALPVRHSQAHLALGPPSTETTTIAKASPTIPHAVPRQSLRIRPTKNATSAQNQEARSE